jgi:hypothetical protein
MIGRSAHLWIARYGQAVVSVALMPAILCGALPRFGCGCGGKANFCSYSGLACSAPGAELADDVACRCSHGSSVRTTGVSCCGSKRPDGTIHAFVHRADGTIAVSTSKPGCRCNGPGRGQLVQIPERDLADPKSKGKLEPSLHCPLPAGLAVPQHSPQIGVDYHPPAMDRVILLLHLTI